MRKITYLMLLLWAGIFSTSCGNKEKENKYITYEDLENEFRATLTQEDTLTVMNAATALMEGLKNGEIEASLQKLSMIEDGSIVSLAGDKLDVLAKRFKRFPVVDYKLDYYCFSVEQLNDIKYSIQIAPKDQNGKAPTMGFMLNPMKVNGEWYLCVKDKEQASKDMQNPIDPKTIMGRRH